MRALSLSLSFSIYTSHELKQWTYIMKLEKNQNQNHLYSLWSICFRWHSVFNFLYVSTAIVRIDVDSPNNVPSILVWMSATYFMRCSIPLPPLHVYIIHSIRSIKYLHLHLSCAHDAGVTMRQREIVDEMVFVSMEIEIVQ